MATLDNMMVMDMIVPPEGLQITAPDFFVGDSPTRVDDVATQQLDPDQAACGTLLGLGAPTFLGSVFVDVTSATGTGVRVEVGDRTRTNPHVRLHLRPTMMNSDYSACRLLPTAAQRRPLRPLPLRPKALAF